MIYTDSERKEKDSYMREGLNKEGYELPEMDLSSSLELGEFLMKLVKDGDERAWPYQSISSQYRYLESKFDAEIRERRKSGSESAIMPFEEFVKPYVKYLLGSYSEGVLGNSDANLDEIFIDSEIERLSEESKLTKKDESFLELEIAEKIIEERKVSEGKSFDEDWKTKSLIKKACSTSSKIRKLRKKSSELTDKLHFLRSAKSHVLKLKSAYENLKAKELAIISSNSEFSCIDDVIRHNHSVLESFTVGPTEYYYRLYDESGLDSWYGKEYYRGIEFANGISELCSKLTAKHNRIVVEKRTKNTPANSLKLWLKSTTPYHEKCRKNFSIDICLNCGKKFHWNDGVNTDEYGLVSKDFYVDFCSKSCKASYEGKDNKVQQLFDDGIHEPVIYRIFNKRTGMSYVGKTKQAFTFRWYQHFFQTKGSSAFEEDTKKYGIDSWTFEVLETLDLSDEKIMATYKDERFEELESSEKRKRLSIMKERHVLLREQFWIDEFDSKNNGYNRRDNFKK